MPKGIPHNLQLTYRFYSNLIAIKKKKRKRKEKEKKKKGGGQMINQAVKTIKGIFRKNKETTLGEISETKVTKIKFFKNKTGSKSSLCRFPTFKAFFKANGFIIDFQEHLRSLGRIECVLGKSKDYKIVLQAYYTKDDYVLEVVGKDSRECCKIRQVLNPNIASFVSDLQKAYEQMGKYCP